MAGASGRRMSLMGRRGGFPDQTKGATGRADDPGSNPDVETVLLSQDEVSASTGRSGLASS